MSDWQPIETAPKDGRWILVWMRSPWSHTTIIRWLRLNKAGKPAQRGTRAHQSFWQEQGDRFRPTTEMNDASDPVVAPKKRGRKRKAGLPEAPSNTE